MTSFIEPNMFNHIADDGIACGIARNVKHMASQMSALAVMTRASDCAAAITLKKNPKVYSA
jgi:hypothetical protein